MSQRSPTLVEVIKAAMEQRLSNVHVSLPAKITKYDAATQKVEVQPLLKRPLLSRDDVELDAESIPVIPDVPVAFPRGGEGSGSFFLTWPLEPGDLVHLVFSERSLDIWLDGDGSEVDPVDFTMHNLSDAVAYPGLYPFGSAISEISSSDAVLGHDGGMQLHVTPNGTAEFQVGGTADVSVTIAETLQSWWDTQVKPKLDAFDAHIHPTGVGPSGPPAPLIVAPAMDAGIISSKVKLKDG